MLVRGTKVQSMSLQTTRIRRVDCRRSRPNNTRERSSFSHIRVLPGFKRILLPKTIHQLSSLARSGPIVFLDASKHRCDALAVKPCSEHAVHVPLSNTSYDEVESMLNKPLILDGRVISRDASTRAAKLHCMGPEA